MESFGDEANSISEGEDILLFEEEEEASTLQSKDGVQETSLATSAVLVSSGISVGVEKAREDAENKSEDAPEPAGQIESRAPLPVCEGNKADTVELHPPEPTIAAAVTRKEPGAAGSSPIADGESSAEEGELVGESAADYFVFDSSTSSRQADVKPSPGARDLLHSRGSNLWPASTFGSRAGSNPPSQGYHQQASMDAGHWPIASSSGSGPAGHHQSSVMLSHQQLQPALGMAEEPYPAWVTSGQERSRLPISPLVAEKFWLAGNIRETHPAGAGGSSAAPTDFRFFGERYLLQTRSFFCPSSPLSAGAEVGCGCILINLDKKDTPPPFLPTTHTTKHMSGLKAAMPSQYATCGFALNGENLFRDAGAPCLSSLLPGVCSRGHSPPFLKQQRHACRAPQGWTARGPVHGMEQESCAIGEPLRATSVEWSRRRSGPLHSASAEGGIHAACHGAASSAARAASPEGRRQSAVAREGSRDGPCQRGTRHDGARRPTAAAACSSPSPATSATAAAAGGGLCSTAEARSQRTPPGGSSSAELLPGATRGRGGFPR
uniref:Uncharacterized protein n=1 Tax=Tetraselmis sp. GSL018 TaxID=582737 RepID=A0A061RIV6_9CHLO